jgi:RimJ/RimL family protein N-acetyltransferase
MDVALTDRLVLRTVTLDDAAFYIELVNDPQFIAYIGQRDIHTLAAARTALREGPMAMLAERGHALYVVTLKDGGALIGMSGLIKRISLPEVDLGYAFLPQFRGHGYALEAARSMLAHARALGLARLMAITDPDNAASIRLLEKLGMRFVETKLSSIGPGTNVYAIEL